MSTKQFFNITSSTWKEVHNDYDFYEDGEEMSTLVTNYKDNK